MFTRSFVLYDSVIVKKTKCGSHCSRSTTYVSWGGSVVQDEVTEQFHMFASVFGGGKALVTWQTNSVIMHLLAPTPMGPFKPTADGPKQDGIIVLEVLFSQCRLSLLAVALELPLQLPDARLLLVQQPRHVVELQRVVGGLLLHELLHQLAVAPLERHLEPHAEGLPQKVEC